MMNLPVRTIVAAALVLLALIAYPVTYYVGKARGASAAHAIDKARELQIVADFDKRYREAEQDYAKRVFDQRMEFATKTAAEKAVDDRQSSDLHAGVERVRVHVVRCRADAAPATTTAPRTDGAGTAELSPDVAGRLYDLAARGDKYARQVTALQAWARSAVALCSQSSYPR